jgi:chemotaxis protein MotC
MSRAWHALALALAALALLTPAAALADPVNLTEMANDLQRLQFQIAQGDKTAYAAQFIQLKTMGAAIATATPETWKDKGAVDSLVIYILSGGSLADVVPLLKGDAIVESERSLARGALAYATNHEADATDLLGKADLSALDARLAGQVAFAHSVLVSKRDPRKAIELLDWSRLLAPGGLVEEAALRREITLLAEAKDVRRVAMLTRQYSTRFGASLYAPEFFRELAGSIARLGLADDPANYQLLSNAAAALPPDGRQQFLLTLAKSAVVYARFDAAVGAATEALRGARADTADTARAHLYLAASQIFADGYDAAAADLQSLVASKLDPTDANLLAAARKVAAELRVAPDAAVVDAQEPSPGDGDKDKAGGPVLTIKRAEDALKRTTALASMHEGGAP